MKTKEIKWKKGQYGYIYGYVDGLLLFSVGWAISGGYYDVSTELPGIKKTSADSIENGKIAAQRILTAFIRKISE